MLTTSEIRLCAWCGEAFRRPVYRSGESRDYCSRLHHQWALQVANEDYPLVDCPRCGHHDMRIAAPDWAICQTCGHQTDRPDLPAGSLTPRDMSQDMSETRERLAIGGRRRRA